MAWPHLFANLTTAQLQYLDDNFSAIGSFAVVACAVSGTNALTMTPIANSPSFPTSLLPALANNMVFSGIAAATNSFTMTARVAGLAAVPIYRDTPAGPTTLIGGEVVAGNFFMIAYDAALGSGAGGFHLIGGGGETARDQQSGTNTVSTGAGTTLTAAVLTGGGTGQGIVLRTGGLGAPFSDTTDTATNIFVALGLGAVANSIFRFRVVNGSGQTQTLLGGTNVTIAGVATTVNGATHDFIGAFTVGASAPAITIYG